METPSRIKKRLAASFGILVSGGALVYFYHLGYIPSKDGKHITFQDDPISFCLIVYFFLAIGTIYVFALFGRLKPYDEKNIEKN